MNTSKMRTPRSSAASDAAATPAEVRLYWLLGLTGLVPFVIALAFAAGPDPRWMAGAIVFELCAAVLLGFLGGAHWGRALALHEGLPQRIEAVVQAIWGVAVLLLVGYRLPAAVAASGAGLTLGLLRDARDPAWSLSFRRVRVVATLVLLALHLGLAMLLYWRLPHG